MHCKTGNSAWMGHFFVADNWKNEPRICEPDKHSQVMWCEINALPDNLIAYVRQALTMIARGESYSEFGWES